MKVVDRPVASLRPSPENPRVIDGEAVGVVAASILSYGFQVPLVVAPDGEVVCGHARLLAAVRLGLESVPCVVASDLTPVQVREFRVLENRVAESAGEWDLPALTALVDELGLRDWLDVDLSLDLDELPAQDAAQTRSDAPQRDSGASDDSVVVLVRRSRYTATVRLLEGSLTGCRAGRT